MNCALPSRPCAATETCAATAGGACARACALEAGVSRARLIDQLLKLSRQEATAAEPPTRIDLHAQLHESINALIALADQRNIDLGLVADAAAPAAMELRCAAGDLRSVLDNLIENALRYTPEGGVVDVHLRHENGHAAIEVVDTGPGIPPDQLHRVFDASSVSPAMRARQRPGPVDCAERGPALRLRITLRNREDRSG